MIHKWPLTKTRAYHNMGLAMQLKAPGHSPLPSMGRNHFPSDPREQNMQRDDAAAACPWETGPAFPEPASLEPAQF